MMAQKHAAQPGIRYLPIQTEQEGEQESPKAVKMMMEEMKPEGIQAEARMAIDRIQERLHERLHEREEQETTPTVQPAFLVLQDERESEPQSQADPQPVVVERRRR